ncbi:hypothetical protein ACFL3B_04295 [Gemmatimonadota bacterium]
MSDVKDGSIRELLLTVEPRLLPTFFQFLQDGFQIEAQVGCCISEFLRNRCRLSPDFIANRVSTVFLDGQPVDDLDRAFVNDGATLALSGAMPGLVGAVMRTNSPLRSFRSSITHPGGEEGTKQHHHQQNGLVRLKLFNTVMSELGPAFVRAGILLEPLAVKGLVAKLPENCHSRFKEVLLDHEPIDITRLLDADLLSGSALVSISVITHE